jgi:drug/metabolite transporter (DMT)-like permease
MPKLTHNRAVLLMVVVALLWSTAGMVTRHLEFARSLEVTFWRAFFAAVSLLVIMPVLRGRQVFSSIRQAGLSLWLSGLCWCVMFTAFMLALTMTSVGNALVTMSVGPLMTAVLAWVWLKHQVPARTWLAMVAAAGGIVYMYAAQMADINWPGTLMALSVPMAAAVNWTVNQQAQSHGEKVDMMPAVWIGACLSSLLTLPLAWPLQASAHDVALLGLLGAFQLALPCALCVLCARLLKAPEISLLQLLEVIFGILLVWLGAGEAPTASVLWGGTIVLSALVINEWMGWRQRKWVLNSQATM